MRKLALSLALALASNLAAAPALAETSGEAESFKHDGVEYTYNIENSGDNSVISGKTSDGGVYRLVIDDKRVFGRYNGQRVNFLRKDVKPLGTVTIAQR